MNRTRGFDRWAALWLRSRRSLGWGVAAALLLGVLGGAWHYWLAPTRVALVNYPDFQAARIIQARPNAMVRVKALKTEQLGDIRGYDLALVFGRGLKLDEAQLARLQSVAAAGTPVYVDGATDPRHDVTNLEGADLDAVSGYLRNGGRRNYAQLLNYARRVFDGKPLFSADVRAPEEMPRDVFFGLDEAAVFTDFAAFQAWRKDQPGWQAGRPRLALLTSVPGPFNANREHVDAVIRAFEAEGFNVVPISAVGRRLALLQQVDPAAVVYMPHGRLTLGQADEAQAWLAQRNIPLFAPLTIFDEQSDWEGDQRSYDGGLLTMSVTLPELDGAIAPMVIAAQARDANGLKVFRALPERLARFASLVRRTVALKHTANADKKLAIYYYKGPGLSALTAGDLEVVPSLYALLTHLKAQGYRVEGLLDTVEGFARLLQQRGPNIGPYAKGDFAAFARDADPALVSAAQLGQWCGASIPQALCDQVAQQFGPAPGRYLRIDDQVAVARVPLGNVVLLPQPLPGIGDDTFKLVHGTNRAPPWPYVASYLWARQVFQADAIMHFGTHGSLEFTPWKQVGLSDHDWPDALIGQTPHVYLYTMGNVGEAMIAKRRSAATIVSHLTPAFREGGAQAGAKQLADRLQAWDHAENAALKAEYAKDVQREAVALKLNEDLGFSADMAWSPEQLHKLADHMETLEHAKIIAGLYTLGTAYSVDDQHGSARLMGIDALIQALAELDVARGVVTRAQLDSPAWLAEHYRDRADALITEVSAEGADPAQVLARVVSDSELQRAQAWERARPQPGDEDLITGFAQAVLTLRDRLRAIPGYGALLADSPARELAALDNALSGGYTPPSSGGDPIANPAALPTGRNLFSIDAEKTPSEQAWRVGVRLADQLLAEHRATHEGAWPRKVAFTLWAGDFIQTEGVALAQILYLLGVEPVRDPFGRIASLHLIPQTELARPRIDVVVQTSGQLRDLAASRLYLINQAVALAAGARDEDNAVAQGVRAVERELKDKGLSPLDARRLASVRVFGGVNGNYGTGIMGMVEAGDRWQDASQVAGTYLNNMGAAYGEGDLWGAFQPGVFQAALGGTDLVVQPLQSNTWGPISLDHVYEFMGGLNLAVREVTGKDPAAYFSGLRNPARPVMREAGAAIAVEARATLLNPAYIEAMTQGGAASAETFAETFRNVYGWNVMKPSVIRPALWDALYETYVQDAQNLGVREFFEKTNPYALQEMTAVMLETARKGYWQPGEPVLHSVAGLHAELVAKFGASGTEFVNDNQALRTFIAQRLDAGQRRPYEDRLQQANEGTLIDIDKGVVLSKEGSAAEPAQAGHDSDPQPARAKTDRAIPSPAWRGLAIPASVVLGLLLMLAAVIAWVRWRHAAAGRGA